MRLFILIIAIIVGAGLIIIEMINLFMERQLLKQSNLLDEIIDRENEIERLKEELEDLQDEYGNFRAKVEDKFYINK